VAKILFVYKTLAIDLHFINKHIFAQSQKPSHRSRTRYVRKIELAGREH